MFFYLQERAKHNTIDLIRDIRLYMWIMISELPHPLIQMYNLIFSSEVFSFNDHGTNEFTPKNV